MTTPHDLPALARRHPLYARLSGQVVWRLLEEGELEPPRLAQLMDHYEAVRAQTLETLALFLGPEPGRPAFLRIVVAQAPTPAPICSQCQARAGKLVPADSPWLLDFFPPYSLGCRARAEAVFDAKPDRGALVDLSQPPRRSLYCPSEWLFQR